VVKNYHSLKQWNKWLAQGLGAKLFEAECQYLPPSLTNCYGTHALLLGVPHQYDLMKFSSIPHQVLLCSFLDKDKSHQYIEGGMDKLPIASASIDLVLLPHTLEFIDNPHQLLSEACRIVRPEGHIVIFGFNPFSLWGLAKYLKKKNEIPWSGNFLSANTIKKWLELAEFELIKQRTFLFRPPLENHLKWFENLKIMDSIGAKCWTPFGGIYMLMAKAKVIPLTPIKLHWKQQLSGIEVSFPGSSIRTTR
jgi:SAM-dependent methyltransferase